MMREVAMAATPRMNKKTDTLAVHVDRGGIVGSVCNNKRNFEIKEERVYNGV
jgi:hypothetical protein